MHLVVPTDPLLKIERREFHFTSEFETSYTQIVNKTIEQRENQIPLAEKIIEEHFLEFAEWERRRDLYKMKVEA